jgi:hypothetical protein
MVERPVLYSGDLEDFAPEHGGGAKSIDRIDVRRVGEFVGEKEGEVFGKV